MTELRERLVWALFKATFHPDEDEALMREKWDDWHSDQPRHYRLADAALAEIAAAELVLIDAGTIKAEIDKMAHNSPHEVGLRLALAIIDKHTGEK